MEIIFLQINEEELFFPGYFLSVSTEPLTSRCLLVLRPLLSLQSGVETGQRAHRPPCRRLEGQTEPCRAPAPTAT